MPVSVWYPDFTILSVRLTLHEFISGKNVPHM